MGSKIVVIDGLARSGTTLLSSIMHSQDISSCYRGVFHEFLACEIGKWKHDYALHELLTDTDEVIIKKRRSLYDRILGIFNKKKYVISYDSFGNNTLGNVERRNQTGSISLNDWKDTIFPRDVISMKDLDEIYQEIAKKDKVKILSMRWNQGLPYISKFLRNQNHYWISVVRNPMDRALSDHETFSESYDDAILYTRNYGKLLSQTADLGHHLVIYFENLINNTKSEIESVYRFLGEDIGEINYDLVQQSGEKYKVETSELIGQGEQHTEGVIFKGFDSSKIGKYKIHMSKEMIARFQEVIAESCIYSPYV